MESMTAQAEATRGWGRNGYCWRDSYSLRCHQRGIEIGATASSMRHSVAVLSSSYAWANDESEAAAFIR